jgi:phosphoglycerate dehydrogenase-like enzyme
MTRPPVIASLSPAWMKQFLGGISSYPEIQSAVQGVDPALGYAELARTIRACGSEILLTGWGSVALAASFREDCPTVRYVCHLTGEMRRQIPRTLIESGLLVTNWGPAISDTIAEAALFLVLACCRRATNAVLTLHTRQGWELTVPEPVSLLDRRVGIHGFGNIAQQLSRLLQPFHGVVSAYSPPVPDAVFEAFGVQRETHLERLFAENDVIVELEALTPQTRGMVGRELLERIRPGGVFVNAGRGKVVRQADLEEIAARREIFIGLDVVEEEPLPVGSPLRGLETVFITPHNAGPTPDRYWRCGEYALANIHAFYQGQPLQSRIGLAEYDRIT